MRIFNSAVIGESYTQHRDKRQHTWPLLAEVGALFLGGVACLCAYTFINFPQTVKADPLIEAKTTSTVPPAAGCVPAKAASATMPIASVDQPGLHQSATLSTSYAIYGNNISQIMNQLRQCAPADDGGRFAATTSYAITWAYRYQSDGSGLCAITNASVGLNNVQIYPAWQPTDAAAAGLANSWRSFMNNLTTHENGHVQLSQAYAAQILSDLQNFPPTDCATINTAATVQANVDIAALNLAHANYDTATNHGSTQGAVLR